MDCDRVLVFDVGNSRVKWGVWCAGALIETGAVSSSGDALRQLINKALPGLDSPLAVFAVCVAGDEVKHTLEQAVCQRWSLPVQFLKTRRSFASEGRTLVNAYVDVSRHGADRWAALIAASRVSTGALCVISAGTAITMDLMAADGRHIGGRILPSFVTMLRALLTGAAEVTMKPEAAAFSPLPPLFAADTDSAVSSGVYYLLEAGLREACMQAAGELGGDTTFIITGGLAEQILTFSGMPKMIHRPELILQGVYAALAPRK